MKGRRSQRLDHSWKIRYFDADQEDALRFNGDPVDSRS
jgi:hypothetical protein